ncbi:hypothetical protein Efla_002103 [Eimeria flavescens]
MRRCVRSLLFLLLLVGSAAAYQLKGAPLSPHIYLSTRQRPQEMFVAPHSFSGGKQRNHIVPDSNATSIRLHEVSVHRSVHRLLAAFPGDLTNNEEEEVTLGGPSPFEESEKEETSQNTASKDAARDFSWGTRKQSYARVRLRKGMGCLSVNGRDGEEYFQNNEFWLLNCKAPLMEVKAEHAYDVEAQVKGGGLGGQSGAIMLAVARELCRQEPQLRPPLKRAGFLTVDARRVERKKFGLKKARKRKQYSKR